ncbi:HAD hydrolase-like protein [Streptomyces mirabilis]|uniref:HAD hydrolase-like protein n=1 Tax=Streptomyces mirabilis TaxID=68239 RepID=UPI0036EE6E0B
MPGGSCRGILGNWVFASAAITSTAKGESGDPGRVWMVGDNPVADIAGAHAVGVPGILIDPSKDGLQPAVQRILGASTDVLAIGQVRRRSTSGRSPSHGPSQ